MLNKLKRHSKTSFIKQMDAKKRKLVVWWTMVGAFATTALTGMVLTGVGHSTYITSVNTIKSLRNQLDTWTAQKAKDIADLNNLVDRELITKQQAKIYSDQQQIDTINEQLSNGVKATELTYGVFLILLSILLLAGVGLYSYGIFSKKEGILYQQKTTS